MEESCCLCTKEMSGLSAGGFDATDSKGFISINAIRLKAHYLVLRKRKPYDWRKKKFEGGNATNNDSMFGNNK